MATKRIALWTTGAFLALVGVAGAAEIQFKDGRRLEGEILAESDEALTLDTKVGNLRATLTIKKAEIAAVDREPLPPGFFAEQPADPRADDAKAYRPGVERYLVVPIKGRFGEEIWAKAIGRILSYAWRHKVGHVVFDVDVPEGQHDLDETLQVFETIDNYGERLRFHGIVRGGRGPALAVLLNCHTIHAVEGAELGGAAKELPKGEAAEELASVRDAIVARAVRVAVARGRPGDVIEAMLDPEAELYIWKDPASGRPVSDSRLPEGFDKSQVIKSCSPGEQLVLTAADLKRLGLPLYTGGVEGLGKELGFMTWERESEYGERTLAAIAKAEVKARDKKEARYQRQVERIVKRRDGILQSLRANLEKAKEWDPEGGTYYTYQRYHSWAWGRYGSYGSNQETNILTEESRRQWVQRTDGALRYVGRALRDIRSLKSVERRAAKIGLDPVAPEGDLERLETELKMRLKTLRLNRNKKEQ